MKVLTMQLNSTSVMDIIAYGGAAVGMIVTLSEFMKGYLSVHGALMLILLAAEFFIPLAGGWTRQFSTVRGRRDGKR